MMMMGQRELWKWRIVRKEKKEKAVYLKTFLFLTVFISHCRVAHTVHFTFISYAWSLKGERSFVI